MDASYDTIVIGSGCGGAAAAALMSSLGHKTLVLEKNKDFGGRAATYEKDGFKLDHGHVLARSDKGAHGEVLRLAKCPDLIPRFSYFPNWSVTARIMGQTVNFSPSPRSMVLSGKIFSELRKLDFRPVDLIQNLWFTGHQALIPRAAIKKYDHVDLASYMVNRLRNPYMRTFWEGFSVGIFGAPANEASAGDMIRIHQGVFRDLVRVGYPVNGEGVSAIPKSFLRAARRHGAEVRTLARVEKIWIENNVVQGVIVKGGKIRAPRVISNAGIMPTVTKLAGREHFDAAYVSRIENLKYSCAGMSFKFALKKKITDFDWGGIIPANAQQSYLDMVSGKTPDKFILMFMATSNLDPSLAPPGCQSICAISGGPVLEPGRFDWSAWMAVVRRQLEELLPGLSDNILFCKEESPDYIARFNGRAFGDAVGVAQTVDQMGALRPSMISPVQGLYHVGADVGYGHMATESASASAIALYRRLKKKGTVRVGT